MDILNRREGETDYEYCFRLSYAKVREGLDIDWQEIVNLCNLNWSADHCRKTMIGAIRHQDYIDSKTKEQLESEQYEKLLEKELKLEKEKVKVRDERTLLNKQIRELARKENLGEILEEKLEELKTSKPILPIEIANRTSSSGRDGVMLISDMHLGSEVDNILDKYNPDICKKKLGYYVDKVIQYGKENDIDKLYVLIAGDLVSGIIHDTNRYESRLNIIEQITQVSELLSEAIAELSRHFYIFTGIVLGNHDRCVAQKDKSLENENFVLLIEQFIRLRLGNNHRVIFIDKKDEGILEIDIKGNKCLCVHGHNDRDNSLDRLIEMFECKPSYVFKGHDHRARIFEKNRTTIICNGAFSGEEYSKNARLYNKSVQIFTIFNEEGMECNYFINLNDYNKI